MKIQRKHKEGLLATIFWIIGGVILLILLAQNSCYPQDNTTDDQWINKNNTPINAKYDHDEKRTIRWIQNAAKPIRAYRGAGGKIYLYYTLIDSNNNIYLTTGGIRLALPDTIKTDYNWRD